MPCVRRLPAVPDLVVDYALLEQVENTLNSLKGEFDGINAVPQAADWGHGGIASAMGDFASNWSQHRERLVASMGAMAKHARDTRTGTEQWDTTTAQQVAR
jgi:hypothetical protein